MELNLIERQVSGYQEIRMKDIRETGCRVCNLLHTLIQPDYSIATRSAWAKTEFAHPTRASKPHFSGEGGSEAGDEEWIEKRVTSDELRRTNND